MMTNEKQRNAGVIRAFVDSILSGDYSYAAGEMEVNAVRTILAGFESSRPDKTIIL